MKRAPAIGIDLGTCYSCAAVFQDGKVEIIPDESGEKTTPSYVSFTDTERLLGSAAKNKMTRNPLNTIFDAKRLIGKKFLDQEVQEDIKYWPFKVIKENSSDRPKLQVTYQKQERELYAEEILAMTLQKLKKSASNFLGKEVRDAIVTVPNSFNSSQRRFIKDAGTIAGLNVLRILNESTAAALAYGFETKKENGNVVVFDWGGSNINISVLSLEEGLYEVKSMNGISHLGGEDFDNRLIDYCINKFRNETSKDIKIIENPKAFQRIKLACEKAKITLSTSTKANVDIDNIIGEEDLNVVITRDKFEELCIDLFRKCLPLLESALKEAKLNKKEIDEIILVGGSTRIPKIQDLIQEFFEGKQLNKSINQDEAVAYGAAIEAAVMTNEKHETIEKIILMDVTPFSLGIEGAGGTMTILYPRNVTIPAKKTQIFTTEQDDQVYYTVKIFEGENKLTKDNNFLGEIELRGLPKKPKGQLQIEVTFDIDANSILNVTAVEKTTGIKKGIVITNDIGRLSQYDFDRIIKDFIKFDEDDKERFNAKISFDIYCYGIKQMIKDNKLKDKFSEDEKNQIKEKINAIFDWRNNHSGASKEEFDNKNDEIRKMLNPIMEKIYKQDEGVLRIQGEE